MKFKKLTKTFSPYDNAKDLASLLSKSDTRKKLLDMGYDPSVNATNRVKDEETGKIIREYDGETAKKKFNNDRILKKFLKDNDGSVGGGFYKNNKRNIKSGNNHLVMYPSNFHNSGKTDKGFDDGGFNYHGYRVVGYGPEGAHVKINDIDYNIGLTNRYPESKKKFELSFGAYQNGDDPDQGYNTKVVNKPENMKPLFNAIFDRISDTSPNKFIYAGATGGDKRSEDVKSHIKKVMSGELEPNEEEKAWIDKHGKNIHITDGMISKGKVTENDAPKSWADELNRSARKSIQREALYKRKLSQIPGSRVIGDHSNEWLTADLSKANWRKARRKLYGRI